MSAPSAAAPFRLYGTPGSLYTGKARSYLIKQSIPFENAAAGEADNVGVERTRQTLV